MQESGYYKNMFTEDEVEQLQQNPNVMWVNTTTIKFTEKFREHFYQERCVGKPVREIFKEAGIDPDILGERRIEHFRYRVKKRYEKVSDSQVEIKPKEQKRKDSAAEKKISQLEHQVAYMQQEIEFLKKLQMANTEARKAWESKHRRK